MANTIKATTLVWLREKSFDAGTVFDVADAPDLDANDPVQIDTGTASLWLRQGKAIDPAAVPPAPAKKRA